MLNPVATSGRAGRISLLDLLAIPAPLISPLVGGSEQRFAYREQVQEVAAALNGKDDQSIQPHTFDTLGQFAQQMRNLIDSSTSQAISF